jgi:putative ATP-binding cassette transporter
MRVFRFLLHYSKGTVAAAAVAGVISGACSTGLLALINTTLSRESSSRHLLLASFLGLCALVPLTRIASELLLTHLGQSTVFDLRMSMSRRILAVPLRYLEQLGPGRLTATLTEDIPAITALVTLLPVLSINFAILSGCLVYMSWLSWKVLAMVILFIAVGIVSYQLPIARAMVHFRRSWRERDTLYNHFRAIVEGAKELKLHFRRRETFLSGVLSSTATAYRQATIRAQTIYTIASSWGQLLIFVIIGLVLFATPLLGIKGAARETLSGFTLVLLYLMTPLQQLLNSLPSLGQAEIALRRVEDLGIDLQHHASEADLAAPAERGAWREVVLSGVTHTYHREGGEQDFSLGPVDLTLRPGELIFIAGGNGSGKTTLAKVLVGLYAPERGEIRCDGRLVTDENREEYRQQFSVVFADFYLFESLLGLEAPDLDERARQALVRLQLEGKVKIESGRLSTTELSQGQRKRLALLTAYLEDRAIYVFDEWAADQDPYFREVFYREILPELRRRGKTVVAISHDERYYHAGDRLVKLEYGMILETHDATVESATA